MFRREKFTRFVLQESVAENLPRDERHSSSLWKLGMQKKIQRKELAR
jgi:hypothetical protein